MAGEAPVWGRYQAPKGRIKIGVRRTRKEAFVWLDPLVFISF